MIPHLLLLLFWVHVPGNPTAWCMNNKPGPLPTALRIQSRVVVDTYHAQLGVGDGNHWYGTVIVAHFQTRPNRNEASVALWRESKMWQIILLSWRLHTLPQGLRCYLQKPWVLMASNMCFTYCPCTKDHLYEAKCKVWYDLECVFWSDAMFELDK